MNLFSDPWIPTDYGAKSLIDVLLDKNESYQLVVNSHEYEIQFIHLLCALGTLALQPKSTAKIRKMLAGIDVNEINSNISLFKDLFDSRIFMQDMKYAGEIKSIYADQSKKGLTKQRKTEKERYSVQMINGLPGTGSTAKTHAYKCDTITNICEECSPSFILNYHTFLMPMLSSASCNGAAYNGTLNFIIGDNLRDTIILNALVDDDNYEGIAEVLEHTKTTTNFRQFPNFGCKTDKSVDIIEFSSLTLFERLFHSTSQLYIEYEDRVAICQCCDTEKSSLINSNGYHAASKEFSKKFSINRNNVTHPYMATNTTLEKDGVKIRPWDNQLQQLWTGLSEYIVGIEHDGKKGIDVAKNVRQFYSGKIRYKGDVALGVLKYDWNNANIKRRLYETYSIGTQFTEHRANQVSELVRYLLKVNYRMVAILNSDSVFVNERYIKIRNSDGKPASLTHALSGICEGKPDHKKIKQLLNSASTLYLASCTQLIPELLYMDVSNNEEKKAISLVLRDVVSNIFDELLWKYERQGKASAHIAICYKSLKEIAKFSD